MPDAHPTIKWSVTIDQANMVLMVLGKEKFNRVADLLLDLRQQAKTQIEAQQEAPLPGERVNGHAAAQMAA